jgi:SAM-dependent methyltransferase
MQTHNFSEKNTTLVGKVYRLAFFTWRRMPQSLRDFFNKNEFGKYIKITGRDSLAQFAGREDLYDREYYFYVDAESTRSAPVIVESVVTQFAPRALIDVGCGTGALLSAFKAKGIKTVGLEYSSAGLKVCRDRGLDVYQFNIESDRPQNLGKFDAAVCFEVAEHVAERCADALVDLLTSFAPVVFFTAAVPGQGGGADHINEQPHEYWIEKFQKKGYQLLPDITDKWRREWSSKDVAMFYSMNIMVFKKST